MKVQHLSSRLQSVLEKQCPSVLEGNTWCNYNYLEPESVKEPGKEIIWLNSNIKVGNKLFLLKELYKKNIMSINDLLARQEKRIATFTEF